MQSVGWWIADVSRCPRRVSSSRIRKGTASSFRCLLTRKRCDKDDKDIKNGRSGQKGVGCKKGKGNGRQNHC